jgi:hypothetical protein
MREFFVFLDQRVRFIGLLIPVWIALPTLLAGLMVIGASGIVAIWLYQTHGNPDFWQWFGDDLFNPPQSTWNANRVLMVPGGAFALVVLGGWIVGGVTVSVKGIQWVITLRSRAVWSEPHTLQGVGIGLFIVLIVVTTMRGC